MKSILFFIKTEFHVLLISSIIRQYYFNRDEYDVTVLLQIDPESNRFKMPINWKILTIDYYEIYINKKRKEKNINIKSTLKLILEKQYDEYVCFHEFDPINWYLAGKVAKQGTKICVAPEGTFPYIKIAKRAFGSRLRVTIQNYVFLFSHKLYISKLHFLSNKHGSLSQTNEVWINHPEHYKSFTNKNVRQIDLLNNAETVETASNMFNFNIFDHFEHDTGVIMYLNHWVDKFEIYDIEIKMLEAIKNKFPTKVLYIKLHPATHDFQLKRLEKIEGIIINKSTIPAELFIANLKNSIVFSFWSASLLIDNSSCKFYWLHPLLQKEGVMMKWWSIVNPTDHIQEIETIEDFNF